MNEEAANDAGTAADIRQIIKLKHRMADKMMEMICSLYARNHVYPPSDFLQAGSTGNPSVYMGNHAKSMSGQQCKLFTFRFDEGSRLLYCANKCE